MKCTSNLARDMQLKSMKRIIFSRMRFNDILDVLYENSRHIYFILLNSFYKNHLTIKLRTTIDYLYFIIQNKV